VAVNRLREAQVVGNLADVVLGRVPPREPQRRIAAGDHVEHQEDRDGDGEEHRHQADQAPEDDARHQSLTLNWACGSSASRSASPSTFRATTVSRIATPGATVSAGAV